MGIWQHLVDRHGFTGSYQSVKRFVRRQNSPTSKVAHPVIETAPGEETPVAVDGTGGGVKPIWSRRAARVVRRRPLVWRLLCRVLRQLHIDADSAPADAIYHLQFPPFRIHDDSLHHRFVVLTTTSH